MSLADSLIGQYALVSYVHPLRGERLNLGVVVWSRWEGCVYRFVSDPGRARLVDERTGADDVKREIGLLRSRLDATEPGAPSPLADLAREFKFGVTVTMPQPARVDSAHQVLERLAEILLPPRPFGRKSGAAQFKAKFIRELRERFEHSGVKTEAEVVVADTFTPVELALVTGSNGDTVGWRTVSFSKDDPVQQVARAKAVYADTRELRHVPRWAHASLPIAVELPKPDKMDCWGDAFRWLEREADLVELFEDRQSIVEKADTLVADFSSG